MTDRYGVMGHPVAHSKSPFIHARFAEQTAQNLSYEAIHVEPGGFAEAVEAFRADSGRGLNVTLPFKQEAFALSDPVSERARRAGAVNTLTLSGETSSGDNTDGIGLVRDLTVNLSIKLRGRRLLLVGAGGAARGVIGPLLDERPEVLVIANRTASKADALCAMFGDQGAIRSASFEDLAADAFDLIINATSASVSGELPPVPASALANGGTAFVRWGRSAGAEAAHDGLGMLVEQAAESFLIWRGIRPDTAPVLEALRRAL